MAGTSAADLAWGQLSSGNDVMGDADTPSHIVSHAEQGVRTTGTGCGTGASHLQGDFFPCHHREVHTRGPLLRDDDFASLHVVIVTSSHAR